MLAALVLAGLLLDPWTASAADNGPSQTGEICMQRVYGTPVSNANRLNCTANDIRLSRAIAVSPNSCIEGSTFNLTATFETIVTANTRYDAGFFFRTDGGTNARGDGSGATGICSLSALTAPPPANPPATNLDGDTCGDLNSGTYQVTFTIPGVACEDSNGDGFLNLPNCTSWHSNQGTSCNIASAFDFQPDTKSKCVCDDSFQVPVVVETASLTVEKSASPTSVPETGGTVTYTVEVTNDAAVVSVTITALDDDIYGDLTDPGNPDITDNDCDDLVGHVLGPGASATCSFKALVAGDFGQTVTDVVTACATQNGSSPLKTICGDDDASVVITDVSATPSLAKTAQSAACTTDVTYQVVVSNNSAIDQLTVNALSDDKFGNITSAHAAGGGFGQVVSTTCAAGGTIAESGNYTCAFVGRIVDGDCSFTHTDTVSADVTDDDGVNSMPSDTATLTLTPAFP